MKEILIKKYDPQRNHYEGEMGRVPVLFDPFVSGILNGEGHDREKIENLVGSRVVVDVFQDIGGTWLLTPEGERQFNEIANLTP